MFSRETRTQQRLRHGQSPIVRILVEAGDGVELSSSAGLTPLHWTCCLIDVDSVETLLSNGEDPSTVDRAIADAVAPSPPRSGTRTPMPIAVDTIGVGDPPNPLGYSRRPITDGSVALASRRLETVVVRRSALALRSEKQARSWRRRGWLVVVANRRAEVEGRARASGDRCRLPGWL